MASEVLDHRAANLLGAAFVARTAARSGIRAILIKGFSLEFHGLRMGHVSADVDVLVEPDRTAELVAILKAAQWAERPTPSWTTRFTLHSVTLIHPGWPIDLDVHHQFPGLLAGPESAFEVLWRNRRTADGAGQVAWIPDRSSSIVLWALHSLRGLEYDSRHRLELDELADDVLPLLDAVERAELGQRIAELGADRPLLAVPAFASLLGRPSRHTDPQSVVAWERRASQVHPLTPWLQVLRDAGTSERPALMWRAVWPTTHDLRLLDELLVDTPVGRVRSRVRRISRVAKRVLQRLAPRDRPGV